MLHKIFSAGVKLNLLAGTLVKTQSLNSNLEISQKYLIVLGSIINKFQKHCSMILQ
jgi:hypothetical protein